jgi:phage terminase large subunit
LSNAGFQVRAPRKHDPVKDRINAINARFCNSDGVRRLFVDPKCKATIESLEKHSYKLGTVIPDKDKGHDHVFDALSYCIAYLYPIRRPAPTPTAQSWSAKVSL